jgi:hypothetical protein
VKNFLLANARIKLNPNPIASAVTSWNSLHLNMQNFQKENIHLAVDTIFKKQTEIGQNIQQLESILTQWNDMLTQEHFPADLKFKLNNYKQYPKTVAKEVIEAAQREEEEIILECRKKLFAVRIKVYQNDYASLKEKLYNNDDEWQHELNNYIPDLGHEATEYAICYRNNLQLRKTIDDKASSRTPIIQPQEQQPIAMEVGDNTLQEQFTKMQKEISQLKAVINKQASGQHYDKYRRQKNESGSGSGTIRPQKRDKRTYHAASRSNSRQPLRSTTTYNQTQQQHWNSNSKTSRGRVNTRGRSHQRSPSHDTRQHRGRSHSRGRSQQRRYTRSQSQSKNYKDKGKQGGGQRRSNSKKRN